MCGLAGVLDLGGKGGMASLQARYSALSGLLRHRGPDDAGAWTDARTILVHRRLSILDLAGGAQPMLDNEAGLALVFNGEIFNFIELRERLEATGCQFRTHSDTEVILHLYKQHGLDFVDHLNGQFAIALRDTHQDRLVLARDRVGICPLFYAREGKRLMFASEIKSILPAMGKSPSISHEALDEVFTFWVPASPNTIFEGVFEVRPGHMLVVDGDRVVERMYWDWSFPDAGNFDDAPAETLAERLVELMTDATRIRLRSDVPVGGYLSGGLDSSILLTTIKGLGVTMSSFSVNFEDREFDESRFQQDVVKRLGTDHHSVMCRSGDIASHLARTVWHLESPVLRTAPVPMGLLSGLARDTGYKVVLTGEGADEVFCGYDLFKETKVRQFWAKYPQSDFRASLLMRLYPWMELPGGGAASYLKSFFGQGLATPEDAAFSHLPRWTTTAKGKLFFADGIKAATETSASARLMSRLPTDIRHFHPLNRAQYLEAKTLLAGYLLSSQGDRVLMKNSVEGRFPFLDHRVIEFASHLPPRLKIRGLNEKYLLKKAYERAVPASVVARYKQPYRTPDVTDAASLLTGEMRDTLSASNLNRAGLFDAKRVEFLLKKVSGGKRVTISEAQSLVGILSTQLVHQQFIQDFHQWAA
ncbi:MAG: asparagine synthase (glutamine-hydrolyzing) [Pseudomonadales bacterium]|nr:asparagine synthase (glutamine-hydrolyzing) [Pseudomonadales bacterium]